MYFKILIIFLLFSKNLINNVKAVKKFNCLSSPLKPFDYQRIFSRKRRFMVFPKNANMKLGISLTKALVSQYPLGMRILFESSCYYILPTTIEEWRPHIFRNEKMKETAATKSKSNEIPSPKGVWKTNVTAGLSNFGAYNYVFNKYNENYEIFPKYPENFQRHYVSYSDWNKFRGHRDRRELYNFLEEFSTRFGVNIKFCILRSICEVRNHLLPKGYSLFQDILRILFSFPSLNGVEDEYSTIMKTSNCEEYYEKFCPISIFDLVLHGGKLI